MIIIVEGIDRVGKTTLCERIAKETGYPIAHRASGLYDNANDEMNWDKIASHVQLMSQNVIPNAIMDRFHLSQFAYSIAERGAKAYEAHANMRKVEKMLLGMEQSVRLIYVVPDSIRESSKAHGSDLSLVHAVMAIGYSLSIIKKTSCTYEDITGVQRFSNMLDVVLS